MGLGCHGNLLDSEEGAPCPQFYFYGIYTPIDWSGALIEKKIDLKNTCSTVFTQNSHKEWFLVNPKAKGEVLGSRLIALTLFGKVQIPTYSPCISK